jgi:hypothetical protein
MRKGVKSWLRSRGASPLPFFHVWFGLLSASEQKVMKT